MLKELKPRINIETISFVFLIIWILLPLMVYLQSLTYVEPSFSISFIKQRIEVYHVSFNRLGAIAILYALFLIILNIKKKFVETRYVKCPWLYYLEMLFIWTIICSLLSEDFATAFYGIRYIYGGLFSISIYASIFICALTIKSEKYKKLLIVLFSYLLTLFSLLIILQKYTSLPISNSLTRDYATIFNHHNHFGYLLCMGIIALTGLYIYAETTWKKVAHLSAIIISVTALLINDTFGSYIAIFFTIPFLYICVKTNKQKLNKKDFIPLIAIIVLSLFNTLGFLPDTNSVGYKIIDFFADLFNFSFNIQKEAGQAAGHGRGHIWQQTLIRIKEHPIFGLGPAGFHDANAIIRRDGHWDNPHNEFLEMAVTTGIPGLILYVSSLISLLLYRIKKLKNSNSSIITIGSMVFAYIISSCFGNPVFNTAPYFFLFLGLIASPEKEELNVGLVGSSGGHLNHLLQLKPYWQNKKRFWATFIREDSKSVLKDEKIYALYYPTNRSIKALIINTFKALRILKKERPDILISAGAAPAIPFFYLGKLMGVKLIYIEVIDRINQDTITGRFCYKVADKFIVQWEEMKDIYPEAINLGSIF